MFSTVASALALGALINGAWAEPKVVPMRMHARNTTRMLERRAPFDASIQNFIPGSQYFITASVGSPGQTVELLIDTGSSDTWMYAPGACHSEKYSPCLGGSFNPDKSKSFKDIRRLGTYKSQYGDGSKVQGPYFRDNFGVGGKTVKGLTMGLVSASSGVIAAGILGLGLPENEAITDLDKPPYRNFPELLTSQGLTNSKSYSVYMDSIDAPSGSVLFGGYDSAKFRGELIMLPIQADFQTGDKDTFTVSLTGFGASFRGSSVFALSNQGPYPVLLDTGTTIMYLPLELFEPFISLFRLNCNSHLTNCLVDCNINNIVGEGTVNFLFGSSKGPNIAVPFSQLAVPVYNDATGDLLYGNNGEPACVFGILPAPPSTPFILGQSFLRSAYVLYDLDNLAVGIAQAVYDALGKSDVKEYDSSKSMSGIATDSNEPTALVTATIDYPGGAGFETPARTQVEATTINSIPRVFDIPQPTGKPPNHFDTSLTPQVQPGVSAGPATTISATIVILTAALSALVGVVVAL